MFVLASSRSVLLLPPSCRTLKENEFQKLSLKFSRWSVKQTATALSTNVSTWTYSNSAAMHIMHMKAVASCS